MKGISIMQDAPRRFFLYPVQGGHLLLQQSLSRDGQWTSERVVAGIKEQDPVAAKKAALEALRTVPLIFDHVPRVDFYIPARI